jgi:hypothetical protein
MIDRTGQQYGQLTVRAPAGRDKRGDMLWHCDCACGTPIIVKGGNLTSGNTKSCGCRRIAAAMTLGAVNRKHGHAAGHHHQSREYSTWIGMLQRCHYPKAVGYPYCGGRGITVCARWQGEHGFENFLADMGPRPEGKTLARIENDGSYEPSNCQWSTPKEQAANRRKKRPLAANHPLININQLRQRR